MLENFKKKLYFTSLSLKVNQGVKNGTITPFPKELYDTLDNIYFCGATLSIRLKYLKPMKGMSGNCEDRSLFVAAGLPGSTIVTADLKSLEYRYGKSSSWHYFVLYDGWIYDPSSLYRFREDVYYDLFKPTNARRFSSEEYTSSSVYQEITSTTLEDLQSFNSKQLWFYFGIQGVKAIADISENAEFKKEFKEMLERINYNPKEFTNRFRGDIIKLTLDCFKKQKTSVS